MFWQSKFNLFVPLYHKLRKWRLRLLKTELSCKMSPVVMSAWYRRTYLANLTACKGSFKSDKQLINVGLIILSLGFFADFVEVLCIAKIQQHFSMLLGKDIHNASVHSFTHCAKRINKHCVKWVISWNLRGREILEIRNVTCQEMWRVGSGAMFLICSLQRVRKNHGLGTSVWRIKGS